MKKYILILFFFIGSAVTGFTQSNTVSFIHGLGSDVTIWDSMAGQLSSEFVFYRDNVSYNTSNAVSTSASSVYIPSGTVSVAHSLGGLLAREHLRQKGTAKMDALITVGTPNLGTPVGTNIQNGSLARIIAGWVEDLVAGPAVSLGSIGGRDFARYVLREVGYIDQLTGPYINSILQSNYGQKASVSDMKPGSSFLNTLNASPNNTLPAARYAIFGNESVSGLEYVRISESAYRGQESPIENGSFVRIHRNLSRFYGLVSAYYTYLAAEYFYLYLNSSTYHPHYFFYYNSAVYFASIAQQWYKGFLSLVYYQQRDWDKYVVGVNYYSDTVCGSIGRNCKDTNDGLLTAATQAPSFFNRSGDSVIRRLEARGANHLEETAHPAVKEKLEEIFQNSDVNIPKVKDPLGVSISGPRLVSEGQTAYFTSSVSDAGGTVSYRWYYRRDLGASWVSVGSGASLQQTFYGAPGGEMARVAVKLVVNSAGESATAIQYVDVTSCESSGTGDGTKLIVPCFQ
tara:strand:- start:728 stop:2266 length:1539 start_codon:yes stop_codon:yes gene_type:complete